MKKSNKFLAITAALTIGFSGLSTFTAQPNVAKAAELQELKDKNAQLQSEVASIREQIKQLDTEIESSQQKIDELTQKIERLEAEIKETTEKMEKRKAELGNMLKATQKTGISGMLDVIFGGKDFSDTMNRMKVVSSLTTEQQEKISEFHALSQKLTADKVEVNEARVEVGEQLASLESAKAERETIESALTQEQRVVMAEIVQKEREIAAAQEAARQAQAARVAQVQAQAQAQGQVQGGGQVATAAGGQQQAPVASGGGISNLGSNWDGTRYLYAGTGAGGIDCSSFTQQVMAANGKSVARTSRAQYEGGQKVGRGELQAGDIVAFNPGGGRVSHVGIYVGNGKFRHADSTLGVTVSDLNSGYWNNAYVGGARY